MPPILLKLASLIAAAVVFKFLLKGDKPDEPSDVLKDVRNNGGGHNDPKSRAPAKAARRRGPGLKRKDRLAAIETKLAKLEKNDAVPSVNAGVLQLRDDHTSDGVPSESVPAAQGSRQTQRPVATGTEASSGEAKTKKETDSPAD